MEEKKFSIKTTSGCKRLIAIFLCAIFLGSFFANLIATDFGKVKVENISIDVRGAVLNADLYTPAHTSDKDSLPAVLLAHGGGCSKEVLSPLAQELARRGYVVMNLSSYGSGSSEQPMYSEAGIGVETYIAGTGSTPNGYYDALNYLRTLKYVDETRIGMAGHSKGGIRTSGTVIYDCGYESFNDILINVLCETFGQEFSEEEISQNADDLAASRLSDEEIEYYNYIRAEKEAEFNSNIKTAVLFGFTGVYPGASTTAKGPAIVAGHEVQRNVSTNVCVIGGDWDTYVNTAYTTPEILSSLYIDDAAAQLDAWYAIDDAANKSEIIGTVGVDESAVAEVADNRSLRLFRLFPGMTHSQEYFSSEINTAVADIFDVTLGHESTVTNNIWQWRIVFKTIALCGMLGLIFPLISLICKEKYFEPCITVGETNKSAKFSKRFSLTISVITVVAVLIVMYLSNKYGNTLFGFSLLTLGGSWLPLFYSDWITIGFVVRVSIATILIGLVVFFYAKKNTPEYKIRDMFTTKFSTFIKDILLAFVVLIVLYTTLLIIEYLFNEDFRIWETIFGYLTPAKWGVFFRYAMILFPFYIIITAGHNLFSDDSLSETGDILKSVIINSAGIWILYVFNLVYLKATNTLFSDFISTHCFVLLIPLTVYISKKTYRLTGKIWLGAAINTALMTWCLCTSMSLNGAYAGSTFSEVFFGIL